MTARRIDHLVLAVRDLDAAARFYESLGFRVGARNRHPWGTENRLIQFRSSFLELITLGEEADRIAPHTSEVFSFGAFVHDYLARREGLAMFVLDSRDAGADARSFAAAGIGAYEPFFFGRKGRRPDGGETHVAFTLAFATDIRLPGASFFTCQQHFPEVFWNPELQQHPNGATDVAAVTLEVENPARHAGFLSAFTGVQGVDGRRYPLRNGGELRVKPSSAAGFTGFRIGVPDLNAVRVPLAAADIPFVEEDGCVVIDKDSCFGVTVEFGPAGQSIPDFN